MQEVRFDLHPTRAFSIDGSDSIRIGRSEIVCCGKHARQELPLLSWMQTHLDPVKHGFQTLCLVCAACDVQRLAVR